MPMLDVDAVGLAYDDVGRRDGVPLVFIHGWTANRHRWDDQVSHFAGRYRVISLDLRGHGDSDLTPDLYTIRGLAREVLALLDGLGVDRFVPVGHSMGGMIALRRPPAPIVYPSSSSLGHCAPPSTGPLLDQATTSNARR